MKHKLFTRLAWQDIANIVPAKFAGYGKSQVLLMEKILLYHPDETAFQKIKHAAGNLKIRCVRIEPSAFMQPLEVLVQETPNPSPAPYSGDMPSESLLLMSDFTDKRMDRLLLALRKAGAQVDFKAVVTPTNRKWNVPRLLVALRAERDAYAKLRP